MVSKQIVSALRVSVWSKKGGQPPPPGPSPGSALRSARERENKLRLHYVISMISGTL